MSPENYFRQDYLIFPVLQYLKHYTVIKEVPRLSTKNKVLAGLHYPNFLPLIPAYRPNIRYRRHNRRICILRVKDLHHRRILR